MDFGTLRVTYVGDERPVVRSAGIVDRINAQTAKNAAANDRLVERSKKTLADVQTREAKRAADNFIRELERMRKAEQAASRGSGSGGGAGFGGALSTLSGGRLALAGGGAIGGVGALAVGFAAAAREGVNYREVLERLNKSFETLTGSAGAAQAHVKQLQEFAAGTPFEFEDVARASQRFQNMGVAAKDVVPILTAVGNAVAAAGGGSEQIDRVSLAISQMSAKGKVSAEEMNQLAEAGVGGWRLLEQQLGKSKGELMKMAEQGQISADTFIRAFRAAYEGGNAMQKQMETLSGATSTLKDKGRELLAQAFTPLHAVLRDTAVELAKISTEGFNAQRGLMAAASVFRSGFNMANLGGGDNLLIALAMQQGGPQLAAAVQALLRGASPAQGAAQAAGGRKTEVVDAGGGVTLNPDTMRPLGEGFDEAVRRSEEALRKASREAERQSDVIKRISLDFAEASTRVSGFSGDALQLEAALYKLSIGFHALSEENQKLAQAEINKLFSAKRAEQYLKAADDLQKTLNTFVDTAQEELRGGKTNVDLVTEALAAFVDTGAKADDTMRALAARAIQLAASMDYGNELTGFVERMKTLSTLLRDVPLTVTQPNSQIPTPAFKPLDLSNVKVDPWIDFREQLADIREEMGGLGDVWREGMLDMAQDGSQIFSDMFMRIGEGWRSMVSGLALDFAQSLQRMAADALANQVWGALLNLAGGALGGLLGGGLPKGSLTGSWAGGLLTPTSIPGRALGGPVSAGQLYQVNESGIELFRPNVNGEVIPLGKGRAGQTIINKTTVINYQPKVTPDSYSSRRSAREGIEGLIAAFAR